MKKIILICFLALTITINGQSKTKYGLLTGLNISNLSGSDSEEFSSKTGFHVGGFLQNYLSDKISIDAELHYMQMGAKFNSTITSPIGSSSVSGKINNDYLRLPILLYPPYQLHISRFQVLFIVLG